MDARMRCVRTRIGWRMSVKKVRNNREKNSPVDTDGKRGRADVLRVDMLACGCVACGWMLCVWTRISVKKKKKKKDLLQVGCERVDALACGREFWMRMAVKKKKKKKKRKERKGNTYWTQILDADGSGCRYGGTHRLVVAQLMTQHV